MEFVLFSSLMTLSVTQGYIISNEWITVSIGKFVVRSGSGPI
jgi:hypothetical protein